MEDKNISTARLVLDRILIKQDEGRAEVSGFEVPESEKDKPHSGTVIAVGPGLRNEEGKLVPMTAKVGDKVLYSEFATTLLEVYGEDYILIKEGDLHLIL